MTRVYLDWNATSPPHEDVIAAMRRAAEDAWGNPSSVHARGRAARALVEDVRERLAAIVGAHARDVVFTSGGTEANNLALRSATALVTSRLEHPSVVRAAEALAGPVEWLPVPPSGRIDADDVARALERLPAGATVALMAVNHETGVIQPVREVLARTRAAGARLHVDAVQALGKLDPAEWAQADSIALAAHKIRGPKGVGALVWRGSPALLTPLLQGGAQERGLRPGTVDPVAVAGFGAALERVDVGPARNLELGLLRDALETALAGRVQRNATEHRLGHVSNLSVPGRSGDELVAALDLAGVEISSGSACSAGTAEPSPVITAMHGIERARSALRVSLGETTTRSELDHAIAVLCRILTRESSST
ncbi:MAG: cysteine desulfurase [Myxococcales bacterium]|nr:cysteine desulfurase [Myxococcales bacterium]MCB9580539.1 cysteine desulfurase [Polyangiaceae bacterium]